MVDRAEYSVLVGDVIDLLGLDEFLLAHDLHAAELAGGFALDQSHPSEGA